eukprot:gene16566-biopygen8874
MRVRSPATHFRQPPALLKAIPGRPTNKSGSPVDSVGSARPGNAGRCCSPHCGGLATVARDPPWRAGCLRATITGGAAVPRRVGNKVCFKQRWALCVIMAAAMRAWDAHRPRSGVGIRAERASRRDGPPRALQSGSGRDDGPSQQDRRFQKSADPDSLPAT